MLSTLKGTMLSTLKGSQRNSKVDGVIFISYRMNETKPEAKALETALEPCTTKTIRINESSGTDLWSKVSSAIDECDLAVIIGSKTYGEKTSGMIDTYKELEFIQSEEKPFFLIKACDKFAHATTRMALNFKTCAYTQWIPGSPMPDDIVKDILKKLCEVKGQDLPPAAPPDTQPAALPVPPDPPPAALPAAAAPSAASTSAVPPPTLPATPVIKMSDYQEDREPDCPKRQGEPCESRQTWRGDAHCDYCSRYLYEIPCMHGDCLVVLGNGAGSKPLRSLVRGDLVQTEGGSVTSVRCVVESQCHRGQALLCKLPSGLLITPWHPIRDAGEWCFPNDLVTPCWVSCANVWNLVLEGGHVATIHGTECVTLGHGFEDPVVSHAYFGSSKVIEDLKKMQGWYEGHVSLNSGCVIRDGAGLASGLLQSKQ